MTTVRELIGWLQLQDPDALVVLSTGRGENFSPLDAWEPARYQAESQVRGRLFTSPRRLSGPPAVGEAGCVALWSALANRRPRTLAFEPHP